MSAPRLLQDTWTIAAKDARELWRDGRFRWLALAFVAVLAAASITGWVQTSTTARLHLEAQSAERAFALDRGEMNPHAAAHYGAFVFKPVEPLSAIDPGLDPYVGVAVFLEAHQQHGARYRPVADATPARRLGELSLAAALQVLVPLLIVTMASGAIVGERERGTLAQMLGTGVSKWAFGLGKFAGCAAPLAMVFVPVAVAAVAGAVVGRAPGLDADAAIRAVLLSAVYAFYVVLWLAMALTVSALARSSSSALVTLLAIWFVACVVAPRLAATAATMLNPSPTSAAFTLAVQAGRDRLPSWPDRVADVEERFLSGELPQDSDMPSNPEVIALVDTERDESDLYDRLFEQLFATYDRQAQTYERAVWAMPTIAVQTLSMALSGTDYDLHRKFVEATREYRAQFLNLLNDELVAYREVNTFDYTRGRELWERIPEFSFSPPTASAMMLEQRTSAAALMLWSLVALASFGFSVRRMKSR